MVPENQNVLNLIAKGEEVCNSLHFMKIQANDVAPASVNLLEHTPEKASEHSLQKDILFVSESLVRRRGNQPPNFIDLIACL